MKKSSYYYKALTKAEVGNTGTHEIYVRMPNDFDYESFFNQKAVANGTVLEIKFTAIDITNTEAIEEPIRFVYFANSNKEKRMPGLGSLFAKHNVQEGDIFFMESVLENATTTIYIKFFKNGSMDLQPGQIYFTKIHSDEHITSFNKDNSLPLQQIFYGAPGTGKSHKVKEVTDSVAKEFVFRTTFHPDSDYSTFVGAYKPTMKQLPIYNQQTGAQIGVEDKIVYSFVPQAFLKAYVAAWQNPEQPVFLVIEEINRGNCAQIFGDIFQLLDRKDGVSEYPIKADQDIRDYLAKEFAGYDLEANILSGEELVLPANLHIWATMNTSDQSLFPIDSAFKRRWDWKYMPIHDAGENWTIALSDVEYDWWDFVEKINNVIGNMTSSEDKQLGYFFCKACNGKIDAEKFVNKVVFYLWNDVFKDYELSDKAFQDGEGKLTFNKFYTPSGEANEATIKTLLENLEVKKEVNEIEQPTE